MAEGDLKHSDITRKIIGCAMKVHRTIGIGFPEVVYMRCLIIEFNYLGLRYESEVEREIFYQGISVGSRRLDLLVEDIVIVELKAVQKMENTVSSQILNYLKVFKIEVGLLLNFGTKSLEFYRYIL